ncbi:MAG: AAA family ATPase [Chloroflexi bacterium]|nr:AAA family ATPase [Chloroflexota bacterium]MCI0580427.1 AAA family ATPase [Chloroflexota bacterium]MCI0649955.1 AAA family ATPase [Chloroflexota bacterium]MCI0731844.1 AAA family ATPase [Chloroflexota bacterium]
MISNVSPEPTISPELERLLAPPLRVEDLKIPVALITDLIFKLLFNEGDVSLARFVEVLRLHTQVLDDFLARMQQEHLVEITKTGGLGRLSYTYALTDAGTKRARDALERNQYIGPTPVDMDTYRQAIILQTSTRMHLTPEQVKHALKFLILPDGFHRRIGPAVNAGSSLFLYGPPGNGKTTIAQAVAKLLSGTDPIWLPHSLTIGGQVIQIFDPLVHIPWEDKFPSPESKKGTTTGGLGKTGQFAKMDKRWFLFQRPAVMVGGELTMDSLDLRFEPIAKFYEAPLQLKANGGMFLIDDFGRQQLSPQQLLNRWIVPLESGIDFLRLQSGQTLEVPFRQLIVFSTNLDPGDLVDGAFLRRIQMKVEVEGPDEKLFYQIFTTMCKVYNIPFDKNGFVYLLNKWFREPKRVMQAVHPRDILRTIIAICEYEDAPPTLAPDLIDEACRSYFVDLEKKRAWSTAASA